MKEAWKMHLRLDTVVFSLTFVNAPEACSFVMEAVTL
jgi:hypothetical protein